MLKIVIEKIKLSVVNLAKMKTYSYAKSIFNKTEENSWQNKNIRIQGQTQNYYLTLCLELS